MVQGVYHITVEEANEDEVSKEDIKKAPPLLKDWGQAIIDNLKELNLGTSEEPKPIFVSALLNSDEAKEYHKLLLEYKRHFRMDIQRNAMSGSRHRYTPLRSQAGSMTGEASSVAFSIGVH
ncbi:hypothetical protein ACFX1T_042980 [Malus domestica]